MQTEEQKKLNHQEEFTKAIDRSTKASNDAKLAFTSRNYKCLKCKNYTVKVVNEKGGTAKVCNAKINEPRVIVDLDAPNCTDYAVLWLSKPTDLETKN
jgi:RNA polymerase-binding transcription factor DksA